MADGKQMSQQPTQNFSAPQSRQSFHMRKAQHEIQQHPLSPFQFLLQADQNKMEGRRSARDRARIQDENRQDATKDGGASETKRED